MTTSTPIFDRYLFADFIGGAEDNHPQRNIRLYDLKADGKPKRLTCDSGTSENFSRKAVPS